MNIVLLGIIILLVIIFWLIYRDNLLEPFDETKIKIADYAEKKIKEFNYDTYKIYMDKYFEPIKTINLKSIPLLKNGLIFCSVASYRDKQCPPTVIDMIEKAKNPEKLVICICQQNDPNDVDCIKEYVNEKNINVKILRLTDKEARGPCWARYLIQQEWRGEEYFLQIDSHMRFVDNWDQKCIDDIESLPEKSCLTNYPSNFNLQVGIPDEHNQLRGGLFIVNKETSEFDGFFRVNSEFVDKLEKPAVARGWGACFSFSKSNLLHDAPYDPYTPHLFFGEEMDIWARMYTNGWYCYAPKLPICFTSFDRSYRPTFWENPDQAACEYLSRLRLYWRFGYLKDIPDQLKIGNEHYNLGTQKTWNQFLSYCLDDGEPDENPNEINVYGDEKYEIKHLKIEN
jgi:hypothetical protein